MAAGGAAAIRRMDETRGRAGSGAERALPVRSTETDSRRRCRVRHAECKRIPDESSSLGSRPPGPGAERAPEQGFASCRDERGAMIEPGVDEKVAFLRRPESYPEPPLRVEVIETHMSWVFLTDRDVYKLKKPVRYDSLDFSEPELRRVDCAEEIRLNRRLTSDVYLGVVVLTRGRTGALALDGPGKAVDWLVHMRRLPADRMLDRRILAGRIDEASVRPAALRLAGFYADAAPIAIEPERYREDLADGVRHDERTLGRPEFDLPLARLAAVAGDQLDFLAKHSALFERRVLAGRIVEGHGDLRPEHICLVSPPAIIDCLEFSRALRILDPADELAFLSLECERLGNPAVGHWFLQGYTDRTGDRPPEPLLAFHRSYRALRRARIAIWHLTDPNTRDPSHWRRRAREYLALASPA